MQVLITVEIISVEIKMYHDSSKWQQKIVGLYLISEIISMTRSNIWKSLGSIMILLTLCLSSYSQDDHEGSLKGVPFKERLFYGGGIGLQFGTLTLIDISPLIGYKITNRIGIGISPTYKYYRYKSYYGNDIDLKTNVFGGSVFARCYLYQGLFAQTEYEYLRYNNNNPISSGKSSSDFWSFFVGGGYSQPIGGRASMYILLLYNLNDTPESPYTNPVVRAGVSLGF